MSLSFQFAQNLFLFGRVLPTSSVHLQKTNENGKKVQEVLFVRRDIYAYQSFFTRVKEEDRNPLHSYNIYFMTRRVTIVTIRKNSIV